AVVSAPAIVVPAESVAMRLGRQERGSAIDLRNVPLKWREIDSSDGHELFTRGVRYARLPVASLSGRDVPLHIGDLVYRTDNGVAEIDFRRGFREVTALDGTIVPLCPLFDSENVENTGAAVYWSGRWQIVSQTKLPNVPHCM